MENEKEKYEKPEMEIIYIEANDIIFASGGDTADDAAECP